MIGIDPDKDYLFDVQQLPPIAWCPVCGGEIYRKGRPLCRRCAETMERDEAA